MISENVHTVLVYGDLRLGFWKDYILEGADYLGLAKTREDCALYKGVFPFAVRHEQRYPIEGELYKVSNRILKNLDLLQGHPYWYRRMLVAVEAEEHCCDAWVYFGQDCSGILLPSGDYLKHCEAEANCVRTAFQ